MRVAVLVNTASGAAGSPEPAEWVARFAAHGVEARVETLGDDPAEAAHRAAAHADAVVVGGGDGTLGAAAEGLVGTGVPLGVLPLGTFNHFARGLGLPTDLDAAVRTVAEGSARSIAAGRVNGRLFLNNAALGLAPDVVVRRRESHGSRLARALATAPVALGALLHMHRLRIEADLDGRALACRTPFVFVTPNDYEPHLFRFAVRERRTDGKLYLFVATPDGPFDALRTAFHVARGHLDRHLDESVVARARLTATRPAMRVLIDGEVARLRSPLTVEGVPDALRVLVPAGFGATA